MRRGVCNRQYTKYLGVCDFVLVVLARLVAGSLAQAVFGIQLRCVQPPGTARVSSARE